jgi:thiol-disulfide isomerase/thioredoxin
MKDLRNAALAGLVLAALATSSTAAGQHTTVPVSKSAISVTPADAATIKRAIAAERGHIVVVNFWATWCGPCVAEFPDVVRFGHDYRKKGVILFTVSADMRKDIPTKVAPFLTRNHADFRNFVQQSKDPEDFINALDPKWEGDLPRTFVYDKSGKLVTELSGAHTEKDFAAAIKTL